MEAPDPKSNTARAMDVLMPGYVNKLEERIRELEAKLSRTVDESLDQFISRMADEHARQIEHLTKSQIEKILSEIIRSGDLERLISTGPYGGGQAVTYMPYRDKMRLEQRVKELESFVSTVAEPLDCGCMPRQGSCYDKESLRDHIYQLNLEAKKLLNHERSSS